jgi:hypothetical protein
MAGQKARSTRADVEWVYTRERNLGREPHA